ncbi:MAG: VOC family protein, partial [Gemmatimonadales bacterium]|nr:VOC family protein [Gemmatimonadales bacterium]
MHVRLVAVAAAIALGACAKGVSAPPASSLTSTRRAGQFVWHDLVTRDLAQSKAFYGKLLGWSFEDAPGSRGRYVFIRHDGRLIGGMAEVKDGINVSQWVSHVSATDVDRAAASATAAGGRVAVKPFSVGGTARIAVLQDPQGAPFGVVKLEPGDPARADASVNGWLWHELWTSDTSAARQFYGSVLGYRTE